MTRERNTKGVKLVQTTSSIREREENILLKVAEVVNTDRTGLQTSYLMGWLDSTASTR